MEKLFKMLLYVLIILMFITINIESATIDNPTYFILTIDGISYSIPIVVGQVYNILNADGVEITIEIPEPGSEWEECTEDVDCE